MGGDDWGGVKEVMAEMKVGERRWMEWVRTSRMVWTVSSPAWFTTVQRMKGWSRARKRKGRPGKSPEGRVFGMKKD
jgi:hypothetical protein